MVAQHEAISIVRRRKLASINSVLIIHDADFRLILKPQVISGLGWEDEQPRSREVFRGHSVVKRFNQGAELSSKCPRTTRRHSVVSCLCKGGIVHRISGIPTSVVD